MVEIRMLASPYSTICKIPDPPQDVGLAVGHILTLTEGTKRPEVVEVKKIEIVFDENGAFLNRIAHVKVHKSREDALR